MGYIQLNPKIQPLPSSQYKTGHSGLKPDSPKFHRPLTREQHSGLIWTFCQNWTIRNFLDIPKFEISAHTANPRLIHKTNLLQGKTIYLKINLFSRMIFRPTQGLIMFYPRGSYLSEAQEERIMALIQEIQPESTVYVAVMRKCHILKPGPYLVI